ncbi:hypothetical protein CMK11_08820 [Candidatus Poribacteria bacterium]|nr:hypothetical protein [Candidatus Poribacteria bacterium]
MAWHADTLAGVLRALIAAALIAPAMAYGADWRARLEIAGVVDGEPHRTTPVTIGMAAGATGSFDRGIDLLAPPSPPGWRYAEAYSHRPDASAFYRRLNSDIRAISSPDGAAARWEIVIANPTDAQWTMSWDAPTIPDEWRHVCVDGGPPNGVVDMRSQATVTIPPSGSYVFAVTVSRDPLPEQAERAPDDGPEAVLAALADPGAAEDTVEPDTERVPVHGLADAANTAPADEPERVAATGMAATDAAAAAADVILPDKAPADGPAPPTDAVTPPVQAVVQPAPEDVNGDGAVDVEDLVHVARLIGAPVEAAEAADVDGDNSVTIRDLLHVATAMRGIGAAPSRHAFAVDAARLVAGDISAEEFVAGIGMETGDVGTHLLPNYPNPCNPETWIPFDIEEAGVVTLPVYDTRGSAIRRLDMGYLDRGGYRTPGRAAHWDGRTESGEPAGSGTYIVALNAGGETRRRRFMLVK